MKNKKHLDVATCTLCLDQGEVMVYEGSDGTLVSDPENMTLGITYSATGTAACPRCSKKK